MSLALTLCVATVAPLHASRDTAAPTLVSVMPAAFSTAGGTELVVSWSAPSEHHMSQRVGRSGGQEKMTVRTGAPTADGEPTDAGDTLANTDVVAAMQCRIRSIAGQPAFTHAGYGTGSVHVFPASAVNATAATCVTPAVIAPGNGLLDLSFDGGSTWTPTTMAVAYFKLVDAVVGRRPYLDETEGDVLMATHASLRGQTVSVVIELYLAGRSSSPTTLWGPQPIRLNTTRRPSHFHWPRFQPPCRRICACRCGGSPALVEVPT